MRREDEPQNFEEVGLNLIDRNEVEPNVIRSGNEIMDGLCNPQKLMFIGLCFSFTVLNGSRNFHLN